MISIYSSSISKRLIYVLDFIFDDLLNIDYFLTDKVSELKDVVINYSEDNLNVKNYTIRPSKILNSGYFKFPINIRNDNYFQIFSNLENSCDHGFDIFSAVFYLISRMEEYNCDELDKHGRYISANSILVKNKISDKPIIDLWCFDLLKIINEKFNVNFSVGREFQQYCTFDIDNAYAFKHKGTVRTLASFARDIVMLNKNKILQRIRFLIAQHSDPYDNYEYIFKFCSSNKLNQIYFFLLGDYGKNDKNISYSNQSYKRLINHISNYARIGIHPSYNSYLNEKKLEKETNRLEKILNKKVLISRFHYLRFNFPTSFQNLFSLGIEEDYSMGYYDRIGFRAGTCTPFYFYDLENELATNLKIVPFVYMDGVLKDRINYSHEKAIDKISEIKDEVKKVKGQFTSIWHNESLSDKDIWKGWRRVFESTWI